MNNITFVKNRNFKGETIKFGKENNNRLVFFQDCTFDNTKLHIYSGKAKFIDCIFSNKSKIVEVVKDSDLENNNKIELIRPTLTSKNKSLEIIGTNVFFNNPSCSIKGVIIYADNITINGGISLENMVLSYKKVLTINDSNIKNSTFICRNGYEIFSNSYINETYYPYEFENTLQKKL